jgi:hypothetical protein
LRGCRFSVYFRRCRVCQFLGRRFRPRDRVIAFDGIACVAFYFLLLCDLREG